VIEGIFFLLELLAMLLLLLKIIRKPLVDSESNLGIFDYIKERPQADHSKSKVQQRA
jgi:hypothetical protein